MKATVIVDNIENDSLQGEWGLCIYIEYEDKKVLLDAGASELFASNADKLNISLEDIDYGVLSHAHYDHANGMCHFFEINDTAKFYIRDACAENCYSQKPYFKKYIGMPKGILEKYKDRIEMVSGDYTIAEGISLIPHKTKGLDAVGRREKMYRKVKKGWIRYNWVFDDFSHEQSLVFDTPKGLVIFNSCSHGGPDNIITEVLATFPEKEICAYVGGLHLYKSSEKEVRELADRIKETGITKIITGHCTGDEAFAILKEELDDIIEQMYTGMEIEL